jgi:transcriptional regulator with XRE-family HTH domain
MQEELGRKAKVSRALIATIETKRKSGSVQTWKKLCAVLDVSWDLLA